MASISVRQENVIAAATVLAAVGDRLLEQNDWAHAGACHKVAIPLFNDVMCLGEAAHSRTQLIKCEDELSKVIERTTETTTEKRKETSDVE
jgi:hypothetical protein